MLVHTTRLYAQVFNRVVVVLRPDDTARELLEKMDVEIVGAERARDGMSHSLRAGLQTAMDAPWTVIVLADMPFVTKSTLQLLRSQMQSPSRASIVRPVYLRQPGNPVGFAREMYARLLTLEGDTGARDLVRTEPQLVREIPVNDPGVLRDIDTPEQLSALLATQS